MKFIKCEDVYGPDQYINLEQVCKIDAERNNIYFVDGRVVEFSTEEMQKLINAINAETVISDSAIKELRDAFELVQKDLEVFETNKDISNSIWADAYLSGIQKAARIIGIDMSEWGK